MLTTTNTNHHSADSVSVRVAVRVRPPTALQTTPRAARTCISYTSDAILIGREADPPQSRRPFTFDQVFGVGATQDEVFEATKHLVDGGQTGSGKTYTLGSNYAAQLDESAHGIIPRVVEYLFERLQSKSELEHKVENVLKVTFLEIYQEQVRDLLRLDTDGKEIAIRDKNGTITVTGIHEEVVHSVDDLLRCLETGSTSRTTGDTQMHMHSSRSHAIFTITLEQYVDLAQYGGGVGGVNENGVAGMGGRRNDRAVWKCSKLHLVDLAGSERLKRTGAEGVRFKESVKINSGLLALGNVISILGDDKRNQLGTPNATEKWAPYRDSKLTRLLQDSLGGNAQTLMIACISPLEEDMDESLNTLKYANRARNIQNKPIINAVDLTAARLAEMQQKIDTLQAEAAESQRVGEEGREEDEVGVERLGELDNERWMEVIVEEVRRRTVRGTNAMKELEGVQREKSELEERVLELEQLLVESRSSVMDLQSRLEIAEEEVRPIRQHALEMEADLEVVLDAMLAGGRRKVGGE
ncbi:hypothetical protein HK097_003810, partial [Rhizophlyctis rosea]